MHKLNINFQRPGPALATWWYWKEKWEAAVNVWNQWILKRESKPGPKQSLFLHNLLVAAVFPRCCPLFVGGKPRAWPGLAVASVTREAAQPWINPSAVLPSLHEGKKALNSKKQNKLLQYNSDIILVYFSLPVNDQNNFIQSFVSQVEACWRLAPSTVLHLVPLTVQGDIAPYLFIFSGKPSFHRLKWYHIIGIPSN